MTPGEDLIQVHREIISKQEFIVNRTLKPIEVWLEADKNPEFRPLVEQVKAGIKAKTIYFRIRKHKHEYGCFVRRYEEATKKSEVKQISVEDQKKIEESRYLEWQAWVDADDSRFKYLEVGRRAGKTHYARRWLIEKAKDGSGLNFFYVAKTHAQAKDISWREFLAEIPPELIRKKNERELIITLTNGNLIWLRGSDKADNLRGMKIAAIVLEEAAFQKSHVFDRIFRPMLADLEAPALFISSPKKGWFTRACDSVRAGKIKDAKVFHYTIYDNPLIKREEIEAIRSSTPEDTWLQEYMAKVVESSGVVYGEFNDASVFDPSVSFIGHEKHPCVLGFDWGQWDDSGATWLHVMPDGHVVCSKEHVRGGWDSKRHSEVLQMYSKGRNIEPGNHVIDRSVFRNESDFTSIADQFREHMGFGFQKSEKDINAGIDLVKRYLRGDGNTPWLHISAGCPEVIRGFREWEQGEHENDVLAALRYALVHAVRKGMTKLADGKIRVNFDGAMFEDDAEKRMLGLRPPKNLFRRERWGWDSEFGVPEIGQEEGASLWA